MDAFVLIVDDHADTREGYATYLKFIGARVAMAANGEEGVKLALDLTPAVIVMDMRMPGLSGAEAVGMLKSDDRTARIPIITLTGAPDEAARGCARSLSKPCTPDRLAGAIREVLSLAKEPSKRSA